ncbi:hypothetical protein U1Q18_016988 [Sarracenia purpurea var. burkii]
MRNPSTSPDWRAQTLDLATGAQPERLSNRSGTTEEVEPGRPVVPDLRSLSEPGKQKPLKGAAEVGVLDSRHRYDFPMFSLPKFTNQTNPASRSYLQFMDGDDGKGYEFLELFKNSSSDVGSFRDSLLLCSPDSPSEFVTSRSSQSLYFFFGNYLSGLVTWQRACNRYSDLKCGTKV